MEQFGKIKYALLCKATGELDDTETHRGTGFVRFENKDDAASLLELSQNLQLKLDDEQRIKKDKMKRGKFEDNALLSSASLLKGELELNGRLLIVLPQVAKSRVNDVIQANKDSIKGTGEDRRNLGLKKEGLLNEAEWIHKEPALTSKDLEQRRSLFIAKDSALKKSPNLSVSRARLQIRNLPKREFYEAELRELCVTVVEAYKEK